MEEGSFVDKLELALRRDERIMRFLSVKLDKYGVKYNDDKRNGLIGKIKPKKDKDENKKDVRAAIKKRPAPVAAAPAKPEAEAAPVKPEAEAAAPKLEEAAASPKPEEAPAEQVAKNEEE